MQQAIRFSDFTAFFNIRKEERDDAEIRRGELVEIGPTGRIFPSRNFKKRQITSRGVSADPLRRSAIPFTGMVSSFVWRSQHSAL